MKDTTDAMERKYRDRLLKRSGEERLKMGCSMQQRRKLWFERRLCKLIHRHRLPH
jgi:hypothetical protein